MNIQVQEQMKEMKFGVDQKISRVKSEVKKKLEMEIEQTKNGIQMIHENVKERVKEVYGGLQNNNEIVKTIDHRWEKAVTGYPEYLSRTKSTRAKDGVDAAARNKCKVRRNAIYQCEYRGKIYEKHSMKAPKSFY